jgi:hypothetical protein
MTCAEAGNVDSNDNAMALPNIYNRVAKRVIAFSSGAAKTRDAICRPASNMLSLVPSLASWNPGIYITEHPCAKRMDIALAR